MTKEEDIRFVCPQCHGSLDEDGTMFSCRICREEYPFRAGIPQFHKCRLQWEIGGKERPDPSSVEDWREYVACAFPDGARSIWITDLSRTMSLLIAGVGPGKRVLDVGAGWGVYSIASAQLGARVWAMDANPEGIAFLDKRRAQEGITQMTICQGSALALPFPSDSFDIVLFNGILELLPEYDTKLLPDEIQQLAVKEARRVLRPGGYLAVAIENRYGLVYLLGSPDEHTGLRFVTVLPRWAASIYSRVSRAKPFRIYTHSPHSLKRLFQKCDLDPGPCYGAYPNYRFPDYVYLLSKTSNVQSLIWSLCRRRCLTVWGKLLWTTFRFAVQYSSVPASLLTNYPFSLVAVASKKNGAIKSHSFPQYLHRTRLGWLERCQEHGRSVIRRYTLAKHLADALNMEERALKRFADTGAKDLAPEHLRDEKRAGSIVRTFTDAGALNILERLQQTEWSPTLQKATLTAFLHWLDRARQIPIDGFQRKCELMPEVNQAVQKEPFLARVVEKLEFCESKETFSNADFNPTNLILHEGKLTVLDWECPCTEHPLMILGHFFLHLTVFADHCPPVRNVVNRRPEKCIGEDFMQAFASFAGGVLGDGVTIESLCLWVATDFSAQFRTAVPPTPTTAELFQRLHPGGALSIRATDSLP